MMKTSSGVSFTSRAAVERKKMAIEDQEIHKIMRRCAKKEQEETLLINVIHDELESQFVYEMEGRPSSIQAARKEAMLLQRHGRAYPPRKR